jgi:hypothetical protein
MLSDVADVLYRQTACYDHAVERGIAGDDPEIGIEWPLPPEDARGVRLTAGRTNTGSLRYGSIVTLLGAIGLAFALAASILVPRARVRKGYKWRGSVSGSDRG